MLPPHAVSTQSSVSWQFSDRATERIEQNNTIYEGCS